MFNEKTSLRSDMGVAAYKRAVVQFHKLLSYFQPSEYVLMYSFEYYFNCK